MMKKSVMGRIVAAGFWGGLVVLMCCHLPERPAGDLSSKQRAEVVARWQDHYRIVRDVQGEPQLVRLP